MICLVWPLVAAPTPPDGYYYLQFVGEPQQTRAHVAASGTVHLTGNFTVEARLRLNGLPTTGSGVMCGQHSWGLDFNEPGSRFWIPDDPGGWSFFLETDQGIVGTPPIELLDATWMHIAATYDGTTLRLIVDGVEAASIPQTGTLSLLPDVTNWVACGPDQDVLAGIGSGAGFYGNLYDLAIWDLALEPGELASREPFSLKGDEPGLLHYWPLDDGRGMARNVVPGRPAMIMGDLPGLEGPYFFEPEWLLAEPFYANREDWLADVMHSGEEALGLISYAIHDFNNDGHDDFLLNHGSGRCSLVPAPFKVLSGDGTGVLTDNTDDFFEGPIPTAVNPFRAVLFDFNGDGKKDFFSGNTGPDFCDAAGAINTLLLTNEEGKLVDASANLKGRPCTAESPQYPGQAPCDRGSGYGGRPPGTKYPDPSLPLTTLPKDFTHSSAAGDIDDDGDIDIFVGNKPDNEIEPPYFLVNDGTGNFVANWDAIPNDLKHEWAKIAESTIADMDGDGFVDLLLCCNEFAPDNPDNFPRVAGIYWGDGSGDFSEAPDTPFPLPPREPFSSTGGLLPTDFDGDTDLDLIVIYEPSAQFIEAHLPGESPVYVQALVNQGSRQFSDESASRIVGPSNLYTWINDVFEVDFTQNGCPDFVISVGGWAHDRNIYVNDCTGRFFIVNRAVVTKMRQLIPIDADSNGDLDFINSYFLGPGFQVDFSILERLRPYTLGDVESQWIQIEGFE